MRSQKRIGRYIRLFVMAALLGLVLSGCSSTKYQAVNLESVKKDAASGADSTDGGAASSDPAAASGGERGVEGNKTVSAETMAEETAAEIVISGHGTEEKNGESEAAQEDAIPSSETEPEDPYESVDETVVVTADVANVREADNENARIYVQLKQGSALRRTGYTEKWSRVLYEGEPAYVASSLLEVKAEPEPTEPEAAVANAPQEGIQAVGAQSKEPAANFNGHIVAIDAGHQAKANVEKEPIGPGSDTMKAKMPEGSVGVVTGAQECELNLAVAKLLQADLESRGYQVVMIRDSHDVNLSNAERAQIANKSGAEIFIRLHANSLENSSVYGALGMCMTDQNPYNASLHGKSYTLSKKIVDNICGQTGTKNRGVQEVDNLSVINWCEIPVAVVEMGFMSNPDEDRWLQDEAYREKIAAGIGGAVDSYFAEGN